VTVQSNQPAIADPASDSALVARLKAGDPDAYEEMVRTCAGRMLSVARRFLNDEEAARDAVQDAFLSAFRGIQRFDGEAQLSTWLHRIVVNAALMRIRSRQRRPEQSIEPLLPVFAEDGHHVTSVVSWTVTGEHVLEQKETRALVRAAIAELPESYRAVLLLRDIEELSTREAACPGCPTPGRRGRSVQRGELRPARGVGPQRLPGSPPADDAADHHRLPCHAGGRRGH
jgi:RNA polymerase sigma-70 factor (ECF subfamily)